MFGLKDFLEFVFTTLRRTYPNLFKAFSYGLPLTLGWFLVIPAVFRGITNQDHFGFLFHKKLTHEQQSLHSQLDELNNLVEQFEYLSFDHHQRLTYELQSHADELVVSREPNKQKVEEALNVAIRASSNNQEILRSLLVLSRLYQKLLESDLDDSTSHHFMRDFYQALTLVIHFSTTPDCNTAVKAYEQLRSLHHRADTFPAPIRDAANLEILRNFTFAAAYLAADRPMAEEQEGGQCAMEQDKSIYRTAQQIYTKRAREIWKRQKLKGPITNTEYLRTYWWIDFSDYFEQVNNSGGLARADELLDTLWQNLPPEFIRDKLRKNKNLVVDKDRIEAVSTGIKPD